MLSLTYKKIMFVVLLFIFGIFYSAFYLLPPKNFGQDRIIEIEKDIGSFEIAKFLKQENIVKSSTFLHIAIILNGGERRVRAGDYLFESPINVFRVAKRITEGEFGFTPRKVTLPEGLTVNEMSSILESKLINFSTTTFVNLGREKEGYLFPDTYLLRPTARAEEVISLLESTFEKRIAEMSSEIVSFNKPLKDIVNMAAILEEEAKDEKSRRIISGILWKRIRLGMPLQVDAVFRYINGKTSEELTQEDLKIDSPYNTYLYRGLPPAPITNPGSESLRAAVTPIDTPYLYFLTGKDNEMYYAKTLDEHVKNKEKYLK